MHAAARIHGVEHIIRERNFLGHANHVSQAVLYAGFLCQRDRTINFAEHWRHDPGLRRPAEQPLDRMNSLAAKLQHAFSRNSTQISASIVLRFAVGYAINPRILWIGKIKALLRRY